LLFGLSVSLTLRVGGFAPRHLNRSPLFEFMELLTILFLILFLVAIPLMLLITIGEQYGSDLKISKAFLKFRTRERRAKVRLSAKIFVT